MMNNTRVFDCFTFFNEVDLLKFRLEYLKDAVDMHVIVESNLTHNGKEKPYIFEEHQSEFEEWSDKILYFKIEQSTENIVFDNVDTYTPTNGSWVLENQHRNSIHYVNNYITQSQDNLFLISDLDEIPDPEVINYLKSNMKNNDVVSLSMLFHYYYMNCQNVGYDRFWNGTLAIKGDIFYSKLPQEFRDIRNMVTPIPNAGYHFSFLGGVEKIKTKIESFAHTEFNRPDITSDENIIRALENGEDVFKRPGVSYKFVPLEEYPEKIRNLMRKYPSFIKDI